MAVSAVNPNLSASTTAPADLIWLTATFNSVPQRRRHLTMSPLAGRLRNDIYASSSISVTAPSFCGFNRGATNNLTFEARGSGQSQILSATVSSFIGSGNLYTHRFSGTSFNVYSSARISFYSIGESLDLAALDGRVTDLMTAIGAAIP